jgi:hypothetical protein
MIFVVAAGNCSNPWRIQTVALPSYIVIKQYIHKNVSKFFIAAERHPL